MLNICAASVSQAFRVSSETLDQPFTIFTSAFAEKSSRAEETVKAIYRRSKGVLPKDAVERLRDEKVRIIAKLTKLVKRIGTDAFQDVDLKEAAELVAAAGHDVPRIVTYVLEGDAHADFTISDLLHGWPKPTLQPKKENVSEKVNSDAVAEMTTIPEGNVVLAAEKAEDGTLMAFSEDKAGNLQVTVEVHGATPLMALGEDGNWHDIVHVVQPEAQATTAEVITEVQAEAPPPAVQLGQQDRMPKHTVVDAGSHTPLTTMAFAMDRANDQKNNRRKR